MYAQLEKLSVFKSVFEHSRECSTRSGAPEVETSCWPGGAHSQHQQYQVQLVRVERKITLISLRDKQEDYFEFGLLWSLNKLIFFYQIKRII